MRLQKNPNFGKASPNVVAEKSFNAILSGAKSTGNLVMTNRNLSSIPKEIFDFLNLVLPDAKWWEEVPLSKIDLSNNNITLIPKEFSQNVELVSVRIANNKLTTIEPEALLISTVKLLDLSSNFLQTIPSSLGEMVSIVELNICKNKLSRLPDSFHKLKNLEIFLSAQNGIRDLPSSFYQASKIKVIDLSENSFVSFPFELGQMQQLETLTFKKNNLRDIPRDSLSLLKSLKYLDLSDNKLTEFSEFPKGMKLDTFICAGNSLNRLRNCEHSSGLTVFNVANNKLKQFPEGILGLNQLKTLDISNNDADDLPYELGLIKTLVRVQIEGNPLRKIRSNIRMANTEILKEYLRSRIVEEEKLDKYDTEGLPNMNGGASPGELLIRKAFVSADEYDFRGFGISSLPLEFLSQTPKKLQLDSNNFQEVPMDILQGMGTVRSMSLAKNKIKVVSLSFINMQGLEDLNLSSNLIHSFCHQDMIDTSLSNLLHLNLSINQIREIPSLLAFLPRLRSIDVSYNQIASLENIFEASSPFPALETLLIGNNKLRSVPSGIGSLKKLRQANFENNDLVDLPSEMGFLELSVLKIAGNPMRALKRFFNDQPSKLLSYLKNRA